MRPVWVALDQVSSAHASRVSIIHMEDESASVCLCLLVCILEFGEFFYQSTQCARTFISSHFTCPLSTSIVCVCVLCVCRWLNAANMQLPDHYQVVFTVSNPSSAHVTELIVSSGRCAYHRHNAFINSQSTMCNESKEGLLYTQIR